MSRRFLLAECRTVLADDLDAVLRSECLIRDGRPDRSTLGPEAARYVRARDLLLQRIDDALGSEAADNKRPIRRVRA